MRSGSLRRQEPKDLFSFRRTNDFESVAAECRAVRDGVGLIEISNFAKYEVTGPGARLGSTTCFRTGCRRSAGWS